MTLSCYMDESADGENKIAYGVAAVIGTKAKWDWLEEQWRELPGENGLKYFKNSECVKGAGQFEGVDQSTCLAIRSRLIELCCESRITVEGIAIDLAAFRVVVDTPPKLKAFGGTPYYHCYCLAFEESAKVIRENRPNDHLTFAFDEHQQHGEALFDAYWNLKVNRPDLAPHMSAVSALDDKQFIPIQVADLFAAMVRRYIVSGQQVGLTTPPEMEAVMGKGLIHSIQLCGRDHLEAFLRLKGLPGD